MPGIKPVPNSKQESVINIMPGAFTRIRNALRSDRDTGLLRRELFSLEQLKRHALTLARQHEIDLSRGRDRLLPRLADNAQVLRAVYDVVTDAAARGQPIDPAEVWLLDNFYLIEDRKSVV